MRRLRWNTDETLRGLERRLAESPGDAGAVLAYDRALARTGLRDLARHYAQQLTEAWRGGPDETILRDAPFQNRPEGFRVTLRTPDGTGRADGIEFSATRAIEERRDLVPDEQGRRTLGGPVQITRRPYVRIEARLLPGPSRQTRCRNCDRKIVLKRGEWIAPTFEGQVGCSVSGAPSGAHAPSAVASDIPESIFHHKPVVESEVFFDSLEPIEGGVRVLSADDLRASEDPHRRLARDDEYALVRDDAGRLLRVVGWSEREFLLAATEVWSRVRTEVERRMARWQRMRDTLWLDAKARLEELAREAAGAPDDGLHRYYAKATDILLHAVPSPLKGHSTVPLNAAGEGWAHWAAEVLARHLAGRGVRHAYAHAAVAIVAESEPQWLWSDQKHLGMATVRARPKTGARSSRTMREESVEVRISYPQSMEFAKLLAKARGERPTEYDRSHPPAGRFEVSRGGGSVSGPLEELVVSTIEELFPKALVVRSQARR